MTRHSAAISVIVLAYNDAQALPALVGEMSSALKTAFSGHEIIIVNDGSHDETLAVAHALAQEYTEIKVVSHPQNQGVGKAFQSGLTASSHEFVGFIDGDGQYSPADFPLLFEHLACADAALGVRTHRCDPKRRFIVSKMFNSILRKGFGLNVSDANAGIKIYKRNVLEAIQPLFSNAAFFNAEILIKAQAAGFRLAERPVQHRAREFGKARGLCWNNVFEVLRGIFSPQMKPYRHKKQ